MDIFMKEFLNGIGYFIFWIIGIFTIPLCFTLLYAIISKSANGEKGKEVFFVVFLLYMILTAIFLINI